MNNFLDYIIGNTLKGGGSTKKKKLTKSEKEKIATNLKDIAKEQAIQDYIKLLNLNIKKVANETRIGNKFVDYFTFNARLETISKRGMNFYEFLQDKEYHNKPYIKKLIVSQNDKNTDVTLYRVFKLHCGSIGIFKPVNAMEIYDRFQPNSVLDFTMGWGGRLVGACALNVPNYIGIDSNLDLRKPYEEMVKTLKSLGTETKIKLYFKDALKVDYSKLTYDCVFTSPPYFNTEIYNHMVIKTDEEWEEDFYIPLFSITYKYLKKNGYYILNIQKELYESICLDLFGKANYKIPLKGKRKPKNSKSPNDYNEYIYVWKK